MELEYSDSIVCNNRAYLGWKYTKMNDTLAQQRFQGTLPTGIRDIDTESHLWTSTMNPREYVCSPMVTSRGRNDMTCKPDEFYQGYDNFNGRSLSDYLLIPCKENTFRNHIECDSDKCCSIRHQLFCNMTKRK